jgi:hypothetical protein
VPQGNDVAAKAIYKRDHHHHEYGSC